MNVGLVHGMNSKEITLDYNVNDCYCEEWISFIIVSGRLGYENVWNDSAI